MKRILLAAAVAAAVGTANAAVTEFVIFKAPNYQGAKHVVKGEVNNLEGGFAGEGSSLQVKGGYWEVCNKHHFGGECRVLAEGNYARLGSDWNNAIVSVRYLGTDKKHAAKAIRAEQLALRDDRREAREERREDRRDWRDERREDRRDARDERRYGASLELYGQPDFRGRSVRIDDNVRDLNNMNFDGRASSAVVHGGTWQVCTEPGFAGRCEVLRPGEYRQLAGLDDRVSSIRQLR